MASMHPKTNPAPFRSEGGNMYKVYVDTGEPSVTTNALTFATVPEAIAYARDLFSRWLKVEGWYVLDESKTGSTHLPVDLAKVNAEAAYSDGIDITIPGKTWETVKSEIQRKAAVKAERLPEARPTMVGFEP